MVETLSLTATIFALIALGWVVVRRGGLGPAPAPVLGAYVANLALPALVFSALTARPLGEVIDGAYLLAYALGSLAALGLGYAWSRRTGFDRSASTFRAMGMCCANSGFIGYPILAAAAPAVAGSALALNMIVENLLVIPLVLALAEMARGEGGRLGSVAARLARNPLILAMIAGVAVSASGIALPGPAARGLGLVAQSSAAVSLVAIGAMLATLPARAEGTPTGVAAVIAGKLVLHPLAVAAALVGLAGLGLRVERPLAEAAVVMAAMPAMGIYPILAARYGEGRSAAVAMLGMTVAAFVTVNVLLLALGLGG
jgi:malonate transporter